MARSARIAEMNQDTARISERLSTVLRGTVEKIIPPKRPSRPGKAQIAVEEADDRYRKLRIENTLTDEHGYDVKLKKGAHVEVTVTAAATVKQTDFGIKPPGMAGIRAENEVRIEFDVRLGS